MSLSHFVNRFYYTALYEGDVLMWLEKRNVLKWTFEQHLALSVNINASRFHVEIVYERLFKNAANKWSWMGPPSETNRYNCRPVEFDAARGYFRQVVVIEGNVDVCLDEFEVFCHMVKLDVARGF